MKTTMFRCLTSGGIKGGALRCSTRLYTPIQTQQRKQLPSHTVRLLNTKHTANAQHIQITQPGVSKWLYSVSALIAGIVVVGGMTRLTESGLSITEWKPITGVALPRGDEWVAEFEKYKHTPEFKM